MANLNVLSDRYAAYAINDIFSERGRILCERDLWIAVMKSQRELGLNIPSEVIEQCEAAKGDIDLEFIERREKETRHDVKARIEAFIIAAGTEEHIHRGMTSRDLTDNVEQMQVKRASEIVFGKYVSILRHMVDKADEYKDIILVARTHHQAAQPTLLGRRFSMWAEELIILLGEFRSFVDNYPLRGIKGPVGTQFDMLTLLGSMEKVETLEQRVAHHLGFSITLDSPGQIYPRSLDFSLLSKLASLGAPCGNFAISMRLMSGYELVTEGFKEGQVGSSAMPHKMNTRSSERMCGFSTLLKMYSDGASRISGDQWEEGDVSESVVRRVILPDPFYASDGLCETTLTVLNEMGVYPLVISAEVDRYLPFLATTELLTMATTRGIGRERSHAVIKKHSVAEALSMREQGRPPSLARALAEDPEFRQVGITEKMINVVLQDKEHFIGSARRQIASIESRARELFINEYTEAARYEPEPIK
ncbi:adenylosuccinate lyase [Candidatus Woesearchaeota archaeon]|nr:adenylosuccinate lyase [Candidatus Woesearchaeota archaeon]